MAVRTKSGGGREATLSMNLMNDYNYNKRRRRTVYISSPNFSNSTRKSRISEIFLNPSRTVNRSGIGAHVSNSSGSSDNTQSSHNTSNSNRKFVKRTTTLKRHLSKLNSVNNVSNSNGTTKYFSSNSTVVNPKIRKEGTKPNQKLRKNHRKPKLLKEITLLNRQNCLAKLLCGVQVAQPPTKSSSALNDYAYLVKAFFDRFSIRGIVTDVVDAAFQIEQDRLDVLDDENDDEDEDEEEEDDESSDTSSSRGRHKASKNRPYAGAQFHRMRRPPFENYEPKYYEEYDRFLDDIEYETVVDDHVPDFMEPDILRKRSGRSTTHVKQFRECEGTVNGSSGVRQGRRERMVPQDIDRVRKRRGINGEVKRGFMGFYNPRFDKTAYLNKRQLELETSDNQAKQLTIAEEIAARLRSPRQCRLLSWFGNNNNNNNNNENNQKSAPPPVLTNGMQTTITTITNTGGMVGNLHGMQDTIPKGAATAAASGGEGSVGSNPGSQVVTVIQQSPVTSPTTSPTTTTTAKATAAKAVEAASIAAAAASSAASSASSMLKGMGQKASDAMAEASSVANHIGSTICPFTISELQDLILKAQNAPFPHFLTTTKRPAQNYLPGLTAGQNKPHTRYSPNKQPNRSQFIPPKPQTVPQRPPPPPPTRRTTTTTTTTTTTAKTTTTTKATQAPPPPRGPPPPPSSRLDPSTFAQMFAKYDLAPPDNPPHFQHATSPPPSHFHNQHMNPQHQNPHYNHQHFNPQNMHYDQSVPDPHQYHRDVPQFQHSSPQNPYHNHHHHHHHHQQQQQHGIPQHPHQPPTPRPQYHRSPSPTPQYFHHNEPTYPPSSQYLMTSKPPSHSSPIFPPAPAVYSPYTPALQHEEEPEVNTQTRRPDIVPSVGLAEEDYDHEFVDEPYVSYENKKPSTPAKRAKPTPKWMTTTTPVPEDDEDFTDHEPTPPPKKKKPTPKWMTTTTPSPDDDEAFHYNEATSIPNYSYVKDQEQPVRVKPYKVEKGKPVQKVEKNRPFNVGGQNLKDPLEVQNYIREFKQPPQVVEGGGKVYRPGSGTGLVPYHQTLPSHSQPPIPNHLQKSPTRGQKVPIQPLNKASSQFKPGRPLPPASKTKKKASSNSEEESSDEDNSESSEDAEEENTNDDEEEEEDEEESDEENSSRSGEARSNFNKQKESPPPPVNKPPPMKPSSASGSVEASEEEESNEAEEHKQINDEEEGDEESEEGDEDGESKRSYERSDYSKDRLGSPAGSDKVHRKKPRKTNDRSQNDITPTRPATNNGIFSNFFNSLSSFATYFNKEQEQKKQENNKFSSYFQKRTSPLPTPTKRTTPSNQFQRKVESLESDYYEDSEEEDEDESSESLSKSKEAERAKKSKKAPSVLSSLISSWMKPQTTTTRAPVIMEELGKWAKNFIRSKLRKQGFGLEDADSGDIAAQSYNKGLKKRKGSYFFNFPASTELNDHDDDGDDDDWFSNDLGQFSKWRKKLGLRLGKSLKTVTDAKKNRESGRPPGSTSF